MNIYLRKAKTLVTVLFCRAVFPFYKRYGTPHILSISDTLLLVINNKLSVTRFGDGEFLHLCGVNTGLQTSDVKLCNKIKEAILNRNPNLLVCLVDFLDQNNKTTQAKFSASHFYVRTYKKIRKFLDFDYQYGNANMTRFYIGVTDKSSCSLYFSMCKQIWDGADIIIFEGDKTRFGVNNDLFDNVKSVRRILCPSKHAFKYYDQILEQARKFDKSSLLLFSLGITATVAASDLTNEGYRVIDIGNLDIEYEWYKLGTSKKVAVNGKQVSEVTGGTIVEDVLDEKYLLQIIGKIGIAE